MDKISRVEIENISKQVNEMPDENIAAMAGELKKKQPALLAFLRGVGQETLSAAEREWLLFLGVTIWKIFDSVYPDMAALDSATLDAKANSAIGMINYLRGENEDGFRETIAGALKDYPQPDLLGFVISAMGVARAEKRGIEERNLMAVFFFLKILIDSLNECAARSSR